MRKWEGMGINILLRERMGIFLYCYGNGMGMGIPSWEWKLGEGGNGIQSHFCTSLIYCRPTVVTFVT